MNFNIILCAAATAVSVQFSCAQEQGQAETSLQFLAFPQQENPKPIELAVGKNKTIPVETPGNELSPTYKVKGITSIAVGITTLNDNKQPVFQVLGAAPALASPKQIILLMRKGENNSDGFVVIPIDGSLSNFSGGSYLFINASKLGTGGLIGDKKFALKPGQRTLLMPAPTHAAGGCQVTLAYQRDENDEKGKVFYDTRWSVNKRYRTLVFFYQDPESGNLGVAPIVEMLTKQNP